MDYFSVKYGLFFHIMQMFRAKQMKTKKLIVIPLSDNALAFLPERGKAKKSDHVFPNLPDQTAGLRGLPRWVFPACASFRCLSGFPHAVRVAACTSR